MIKKFIKSLFETKVTYGIGDKAPQSLLDAKNEQLGAFITICPCCKRIDNIIIP